MSKSVTSNDVTTVAASGDGLEQELAQTRLCVDTVSRQLTSLTSDVATLSADVRHIMSLLHTRLLTSSVSGGEWKWSASGRSSPVIAGILKSSSSSSGCRPAHRVEFRSAAAAQQSDLRSSSSSASLAAAVTRVNDQLSTATPPRRRRQSMDLTSSRRVVAHCQRSPLTLDQQPVYHTRTHHQQRPGSLTIPSTDL